MNKTLEEIRHILYDASRSVNSDDWSVAIHKVLYKIAIIERIEEEEKNGIIREYNNGVSNNTVHNDLDGISRG